MAENITTALSEPTSFIRVKVETPVDYVDHSDDNEAKKQLQKVREIRRKYVYPLPLPDDAAITSDSALPTVIYKQNDEGIFEVYVSSAAGESERSETDTSHHKSSDTTNIFPVKDWNEFSRDYEFCRSIVKDNKKVNTFCTKRLTVLEYLFDAHMLLNSEAENKSNTVDTRDFYSITKVDTHVHLSAAFAPKDLLSFIREKILDTETFSSKSNPVLRNEPLSVYCAKANLTASNVNIDSLTFQGDVTLFGKNLHHYCWSCV